MSSRILAGRYELIEKIGEGGMAVVYKARCRLLNRFVAIKILKPEFTKDVKVIESFRRESQSAAALSHPNIVNVFDVGREGNIHYIVMELIEGKVLSDLIKEEGPMDPRRAVSIAKQMASALSTAHKNHIIHRDVKPHNILITEDGTAKITDFGIAKAVNSGTIVGNRTSTIMGSVHYFSPEQARGGYVDEKSDIYSLGIVLYEMLTGKVPFDADNPVAVALMHMNDEIAPPSDLVSGIPGDLEDIVLKATAKYQVNRYKSADEMVTALNLISFNSSEMRSRRSEEEMKATRVMPAVARSGSAADAVGSAPASASGKGRRIVDEEDSYYEDEPEEKPKRKLGRKASAPKDTTKKKGKFSFNKIKVAAVILALLCAIPASRGVLWAMDAIFSGNEEIEVPNLVDKTVDEATAELEALGLILNRGLPVSSDKEQDVIVHQNPLAGNKLKAGGSVTVDFSRGTADEEDDGLIIPNIINKTMEQAVSQAQAYGFNVLQTAEIYSEIPEGLIIDQRPEGNTPASPGTTINVTVSLGPETKTMINLVGQTQASAETMLLQNGLAVGDVKTEPSDTYPAGQVTWQSETVGAEVASGTKVDLRVSEGPAVPEPEPQPEPEPDPGVTENPDGTETEASKSGSISVYIPFTDAVNSVFYMTVTISDEQNIRTVVNNEQKFKENGGENRTFEGTGKGTIIVTFDGARAASYNVDFGTEEIL